MYPTEMKFVSDLNNGAVIKAGTENQLIDTTGAVTLHIRVNRDDYPSEEVKKAIREICEKVVEYCC